MPRSSTVNCKNSVLASSSDCTVVDVVCDVFDDVNQYVILNGTKRKEKGKFLKRFAYSRFMNRELGKAWFYLKYGVNLNLLSF